jgi:hypothetical protein
MDQLSIGRAAPDFAGLLLAAQVGIVDLHLASSL